MASIRHVSGSVSRHAFTRRMWLYAVGVAVTAGCLIAASASAAGPLTAAAYRAHARVTCTVAKVALDAQPTPKYGETAVMVNDWTAAIAIEQTEIAALKRLIAPASLAPLVRSGLRDKATQVAVFKNALAAVRAGTPSLQAAFLLTKAPDDSRVWAKVGVAVCQY